MDRVLLTVARASPVAAAIAPAVIALPSLSAARIAVLVAPGTVRARAPAAAEPAGFSAQVFRGSAARSSRARRAAARSRPAARQGGPGCHGVSGRAFGGAVLACRRAAVMLTGSLPHAYAASSESPRASPSAPDKGRCRHAGAPGGTRAGGRRLGGGPAGQPRCAGYGGAAQRKPATRASARRGGGRAPQRGGSRRRGTRSRRSAGRRSASGSWLAA